MKSSIQLPPMASTPMTVLHVRQSMHLSKPGYDCQIWAVPLCIEMRRTFKTPTAKVLVEIESAARRLITAISRLKVPQPVADDVNRRGYCANGDTREHQDGPYLSAVCKHAQMAQ